MQWVELALVPTPGNTLIDLVPSAGNPLGHTIVFDGTTPNTDVTGELDDALVQIVPVPAPSSVRRDQQNVWPAAG